MLDGGAAAAHALARSPRSSSLDDDAEPSSSRKLKEGIARPGGGERDSGAAVDARGGAEAPSSDSLSASSRNAHDGAAALRAWVVSTAGGGGGARAAAAAAERAPSESLDALDCAALCCCRRSAA